MGGSVGRGGREGRKDGTLTPAVDNLFVMYCKLISRIQIDEITVIWEDGIGVELYRIDSVYIKAGMPFCGHGLAGGMEKIA